jgi:REP element-mobilizing transposase RayT
MKQTKTYYRRHLPHYPPPDATYHVVFRLAGSLPREVIERLRYEREAEEKRISGFGNARRKSDEWHAHQAAYFERYDACLDESSVGPRWLADEQVARVVTEALRYRDGAEYDLLAYCVMPNHVHMVHSTVGRNGIPTYIMLQSLKRHTARKANIILRRSGTFWQDESYDHVIRNGEELEQTVWYVLNNPVKAGLASSWEQWQWTYMKPGLL